MHNLNKADELFLVALAPHSKTALKKPFESLKEKMEYHFSFSVKPVIAFFNLIADATITTALLG